MLRSEERSRIGATLGKVCKTADGAAGWSAGGYQTMSSWPVLQLQAYTGRDPYRKCRKLTILFNLAEKDSEYASGG